MSEDIREQLSALMDGELPRDERAFLLRRLEHDAELRGLWTRMHLVRDVMAHRPGGAPLNLADQVMQTLHAQDAMPVPELRVRRAWRPFAGLALAASVALAAVLALSPRAELAPASPLADGVATARSALPAGVPGPIAPTLAGLGAGVQPVAGERSRVLPLTPIPISAEQMLLMRHGQLVDGAWWVGGAQPVYADPQQRMLVPVSQDGEIR